MRFANYSHGARCPKWERSKQMGWRLHGMRSDLKGSVPTKNQVAAQWESSKTHVLASFLLVRKGSFITQKSQKRTRT